MQRDRVWVGLLRGMVVGTALAALTAFAAPPAEMPNTVLEQPQVYAPVLILGGGAIGVLLSQRPRKEARTL